MVTEEDWLDVDYWGNGKENKKERAGEEELGRYHGCPWGQWEEQVGR